MKQNTRNTIAAVLFLALVLGTEAAIASTTGAEFQSGSDRVEGWVGGYYGRMVAFGATGLGILFSAITKSFLPALSGLGLALVVPIVTGIIDASFTAVI